MTAAVPLLFATSERAERLRDDQLEFMESSAYPACNAPDTGNMEVLSQFGSPEHQQRWLRPLLDGTIRSAFAMTEPEVASSDPTNLRVRLRRVDGGGYVFKYGGSAG